MDPNALLEAIVENLIFLQDPADGTKEEIKAVRIDLQENLLTLRNWLRNGEPVPTIKVRIVD